MTSKNDINLFKKIETFAHNLQEKFVIPVLHK